jgi:transcription antitermination factor NusG
MSIHDRQWPWFAIMVKTTREKCARDMLETAGYTCFLPLHKFTRRWSDRTMKCEGPLFPGYLFCRMDPLNRFPILMTPGVLQIVGSGKTPTPIQEVEIAAMQRVAESGLSSSPWPYAQAGDVVQIERGPLQGLTGIVIKVKSEWKLVLSVEMLQRSVAVEIDRDWISARLQCEGNPNHHSSAPRTRNTFVLMEREAGTVPRVPAA